MTTGMMGPTAYGVFLLADDYLQAAEDTAGRSGKLTDGPTRLLSYHACELYLKAYLRAKGESLDALRPHGHDLLALLELAETLGLMPHSLKKRLKKASETKEYVHVRYEVSADRFIAPLSQVVGLAKDVRECVRLALEFDELGNPTRPK